jgi:PAS domain S-box-containing protein
MVMADKLHKEIRDVILDSISEGVFTVDLDFRITSFNRAAEEITGIPRQAALGQKCKDILRADICEAGIAVSVKNRAVKSKKTKG